MGRDLRDWAMAVLMFFFILLYGAVVVGWLRPLPGEHLAARLEPIIFVFLGYYFSRSPSQQNERGLREEVLRQTQKADAAQHAKEQAQEARESLEEKVKNARAIIATVAPAGDGALRATLAAALNVLNS